jgi:NADH-quinone oxidoreductase subunit G
LAWVPRRAGERGAVEAGALPGLLPAGRPLGDASAREQTAAAWNVNELPTADGRDTSAILAAARDGELEALLIGGVELADLPDPDAALAAVDAAPFVVSLELRESAVTNLADVVFPVAPVVEKAGTFVDWEGRTRTFEAVLNTTAMSDARVLDALAAEFRIELGCGDAGKIRREIGMTPPTDAPRPAAPTASAAPPAIAGSGEVILATWHHLLDLGSLTDGDDALMGTARPPVARIGKTLAGKLGVSEGDPVTVGTERGAITLPAAITDMAEGVVWLPTNSPGSTVRRSLGVGAGAVVKISAGGAK